MLPCETAVARGAWAARRDPVMDHIEGAARRDRPGAPAQHLPALLLGHVVDLRQATVRVTSDRVRCPGESRCDLPHHRRIQTRGRVLKVAGHGLRGVYELDRYVERRRSWVHRERLDDGVRQVEFAERAVVQRERRLEDGVDPHAALRRYTRDDLIEGHF